MKKILVTGSSGFIGRSLLRAMQHSNVEIHAAFNNKRPESFPNVTAHQINLLDIETVETLIKEVKPDILVQLAWCTGQGSYWKDLANLEWLTTNLKLAKIFSENGGKHAVFAGTSAEYSWAGSNPLNEKTTPLEPLLLYGGCKLSSYWALTRLFEQYNMRFNWVRFFNPFGEGEDFQRLIPRTCNRILSNEVLQFDAAMSIRDFLHVDDVGSALKCVIESDIPGAVNIGSGIPTTVKEVITSIANYYNKSDKVIFAPQKEGETITDSVLADTTRLDKEFGWKPEKNFIDRIAQTCEWWKEQNKFRKR